MSQKVIIGIAGEMGSGKGTVTGYLVEKYGAQHLRYSHILEDILARLSLEYTRQNLAILGEGLRATFGGNILSQALRADITASEAPVVVFEGIRKKEELDAMRDLDGFVFLYVDAPIETRYRRLVMRNEKVDDNTKTFDDFQKDHLRPADRDVPRLEEEADYIIDNSVGYEEMYRQVDQLMTTLNVAPCA